VWPVALSGRLPVVALVGHHPTNKLIGRGPIPDQKPFPHTPMRGRVISGIRPSFPSLSRSQGQIAHVLLTRSPLIPNPKAGSPLDLHVLSTPPAFVLSQDQTLHQGTTPNHPPHKPRGKAAGKPRKNSNPSKKHTPQPPTKRAAARAITKKNKLWHQQKKTRC